MAEIQRLEKVVAALRSRAAKAQKDSDASVIVGYTASYALFVHENIEMKWKGKPRRRPAKGTYWGPHGQAKFLEQPAREFAKEIGDIVRQALLKGKTLAQGLLLGGLRLQRESMKLVPIDTGNLRASAFTRLE